MNDVSVRIIILNYNGEQLLQECLPSIVEAAEYAPLPTRISILDNHSTDASKQFVLDEYPDVKFVRAKQNLYLCSYNDYLKEIDEPIVILLNNDIRVHENFVAPLVQPFLKEDDVFLVAPRVMEFNGLKVQAGHAKAGYRFGMFWCDARYPGYEKDVLHESETFSSGFGAFDRELFNQLGGYDCRFLPGIMEDVDLCYRAKLAGHQCRYEPMSIVYHHGQASFKEKFGSLGIAIMAHRNNFLFMWKNFRGAKFWISHLFWLPFRLLYSALKGDLSLARGFFQALSLNKRKCQ